MARRIKSVANAVLLLDTAAAWASVDPVLAEGEIGVETDTGIMRVGDGTTAFTGLAARERLTSASKALTATATLDFPSISSNEAEDLTIAVPGAVVGATVALGPPAVLEAGLAAFGFVSAADTVTVRMFNSSTGAVDPASATWRATVFNA